MDSTLLDRKEKQELLGIRSRRIRSLKGYHLFLLIVFALISIVILSAVARLKGQGDENYRGESLFAQEFIFESNNYREWIESHGVTVEVRVFDALSGALLKSGKVMAKSVSDPKSQGLFESFYLSLHHGLLRLGFVCIVSIRLLIASLLVAGLVGYRTLSPYNARDLLGTTGNGRLFFSGLRASLENTNDDGVPNLLVPGLACPPLSTKEIFENSELRKLLGDDTPESISYLARVILAHGDWPAFVPAQDEEDRIKKRVVKCSLLSGSVYALESALTLIRAYREGNYKAADQPDSLKSNEEINISEGEIQPLLAYSLDRALTPEMKQALRRLSDAQISSLVLAIYGGKVLAYTKEGGKWYRKSLFPHLSARAILHSAPTLSDEMSYGERTVVRQALVYASRSSVLGPVRFPVDLPLETLALRQWAEVLVSGFHEVPTVSDEVELFGLVTEAHRVWSQRLIDGISAIDPAVVDGAFASDSGLLFLSLPSLVKMLRECLSQDQRKRLEELVSLVSQKQRMHTFSNDQTEGQEKSVLSSTQKIFTPIPFNEMAQLASFHGVSLQDIKDWSSFRVILHSFGWLARRVGNSFVQENSITLSVFRSKEQIPDLNQFGRFGRKAMVPLRGSRLEERFGSNWRKRLTEVEGAAIATNNEDYDRLLRGIDISEEESEGEGESG